MINLTETGRVKDELEENPLAYQSIIDGAEVGICITDAQGKFFAVNDAYCKIYGYSKEELIGEHFTLVVPKADKEELSELHDTFIEKEYEILRSWRVQRKDGTLIEIFVDAAYSDKIDPAGHKITFVEPKLQKPG